MSPSRTPPSPTVVETRPAGGPGGAGPAPPAAGVSVPLQSAPDSSELHDRARSLQARFERDRRRRLPRTWRWSGGRCDERIGRFCLRFGRDDDERDPPEEPATIAEARAELLDELARIGEALPGDRWVLGQRIHYLGEQGRWDRAVALAERCDAVARGWWCPALRGYALHRSGRYPEADAAFAEALETMDAERRREWSDPEPLLDGRGRELWEEAEEDDDVRGRILDRMWRLADPLYLVPGNDRRTEHYARHVAVWIREDARSPYGIFWSGDLARMLVRYGPEEGWERERRQPVTMEEGGVIGHHHPESRRYAPPGGVLADPLSAGEVEWDLDVRRPRSTHVPRYAPVLDVEPFQVGLFRRGEDVIAVAGYRRPDGDAERGRGAVPGEPAAGVRAGLHLVVPDSGIRVRTVRTGPPAGGLAARAPAGAYVVSVEVWSPEDEVGARRRLGVEREALLPGTPALSDLLVLDAAEALPASLEEVVGRLRPVARICPGETATVAWELYGLGDRSGSLEFGLRLDRVDPGLLERIGGWLGIGDPSQSVVLDWSESAPDAAGPALRAVDLGLPDDLPSGRYRLRVRVGSGELEPLEVARRVDVPEECPEAP